MAFGSPLKRYSNGKKQRQRQSQRVGYEKLRPICKGSQVLTPGAACCAPTKRSVMARERRRKRHREMADRNATATCRALRKTNDRSPAGLEEKANSRSLVGQKAASLGMTA